MKFDMDKLLFPAAFEVAKKMNHNRASFERRTQLYEATVEYHFFIAY